MIKEDIVKIIDYYKTFGFQNTCITFEISAKNLTNLLQENSIHIRNKAEAYKQRGKNYSKIMFEILLQKTTKEDLLDMYYHHDIIYVARFYNTSTNSIYKLLSYYGIAKLSGSDKRFMRVKERIPKERLIHTYDQCKNVAKTCKLLDISSTTIHKLAYAYDLYSYIFENDAMHTVTKDILEDLYVNKRLPIIKICQELKTSPDTLKLLLKKYNLTRKFGLYPSKDNSIPNLRFEEALQKAGIFDYSREFRLYLNDLENKYRHFKYDFKVGNILIEINPSITHNVTKGIRGGQAPVKDIFYHKRKSLCAFNNNYRCVHI